MAVAERAKKHHYQRFRDVSEAPECPGITYGIYNYSKISKCYFHDFSKNSDLIFVILEESEILMGYMHIRQWGVGIEASGAHYGG